MICISHLRIEKLKKLKKSHLVDNDKTVCKSLEKIKPNIFTNGGDRHNEEIPEAAVCRKYGIELLDGMGKKIRSSSDLTGLKSI